MLVIREVFTAKPGQAMKLAKVLKDVVPLMGGLKVRVMTDFIGAFNTVVMEVEMADLGQFEALMRDYSSRADVQERMRGYTDLWTTGRREVYRVV